MCRVMITPWLANYSRAWRTGLVCFVKRSTGHDAGGVVVGASATRPPIDGACPGWCPRDTDWHVTRDMHATRWAKRIVPFRYRNLASRIRRANNRWDCFKLCMVVAEWTPSVLAYLPTRVEGVHRCQLANVLCDICQSYISYF